MAKLNARGRTELERIETVIPGTYYVHMSDGKVLVGGHGKYKLARNQDWDYHVTRIVQSELELDTNNKGE